jgi:hypothetical protein
MVSVAVTTSVVGAAFFSGSTVDKTGFEVFTMRISKVVKKADTSYA